MFRYPLTATGLKWIWIVLPVTAVFVWLFNSYKLGKFRRKKTTEIKHERISTKNPFYSSISSILIGLSIIIVLAMILSLSACSSHSEDILHLGLNAEVVGIDAENMILYIQDADPDTEVFGQRCALDCKQAAESFQLFYVDYKTHELIDLSFSEFQVGDSILVGMYEAECQRAENTSAQAKQVQLGTQREVGVQSKDYERK